MVADEKARLPQLTATTLPAGPEEAPLRRRLLDEYGIEVGGGLGEFAGRAWRIGLMGHNATDRLGRHRAGGDPHRLAEAGPVSSGPSRRSPRPAPPG